MSSMFSVSNNLNRTIFNAENTEELPGTLITYEGFTKVRIQERTVFEAYDYSGRTYDFYSKIFGRNSIDKRGMRLDSTVHYAEK